MPKKKSRVRTQLRQTSIIRKLRGTRTTQFKNREMEPTQTGRIHSRRSRSIRNSKETPETEYERRDDTTTKTKERRQRPPYRRATRPSSGKPQVHTKKSRRTTPQKRPNTIHGQLYSIKQNGTTSNSTPIAPASCNSKVCLKTPTASSAVFPIALKPPIQVALPGTKPT